MGRSFKGSRTEQNLVNAFAGESQARNRYTYYAKVAQKEGYEQIAAIFLETAENELEHAKLFFNHIGNNPMGHVDSFYPFEIGTTVDNLNSAIAGEVDEYEVLYQEAEIVANEEGFESIANTFKNVREAEKHHASRYKKILQVLKNGTIFDKDEETFWHCRKCGYVRREYSAPEFCPNCHHPQSYFEVLCEKY